jgi:hypothetical protein
MAMHYGSSNLNVSRYYAKIHETNAPSLRLFEMKLGYARCGYARCFGEYELECDMDRPEMLTRHVEERGERRSSSASGGSAGSAGWERGGGRTTKTTTTIATTMSSYIEDGDDADRDRIDEGKRDGIDDDDDNERRRPRKDCHGRIYDTFDCPP